MNLDAISELKIEGTEVKDFRTLSKTLDKDQELLLDIYGKTGRIILRFNNHIFSEEKAREFLDTYISFIEALCRSPDSKMCDVSVINAAETAPVTSLETTSLLEVNTTA